MWMKWADVRRDIRFLLAMENVVSYSKFKLNWNPNAFQFSKWNQQLHWKLPRIMFSQLYISMLNAQCQWWDLKCKWNRFKIPNHLQINNVNCQTVVRECSYVLYIVCDMQVFFDNNLKYFDTNSNWTHRKTDEVSEMPWHDAWCIISRLENCWVNNFQVNRSA